MCIEIDRNIQEFFKIRWVQCILEGGQSVARFCGFHHIFPTLEVVAATKEEDDDEDSGQVDNMSTGQAKILA